MLFEYIKCSFLDAFSLNFDFLPIQIYLICSNCEIKSTIRKLIIFSLNSWWYWIHFFLHIIVTFYPSANITFRWKTERNICNISILSIWRKQNIFKWNVQTIFLFGNRIWIRTRKMVSKFIIQGLNKSHNKITLAFHFHCRPNSLWYCRSRKLIKPLMGS